MLPAVSVQCPYCGETIELLVDAAPDPSPGAAFGDASGDQRYIEDCPVCCRPIEVAVVMEDGAPRVHVAADSD